MNRVCHEYRQAKPRAVKNRPINVFDASVGERWVETCSIYFLTFT